MNTTHTATAGSQAQDLPAPGKWELDAGHAEVAFIGRHFMVSKVRGRFTDVTATLDLREPVEDSRVEATIDMRSVTSGDAARDEHLRSSDLFEVEAHPVATFRSTGFTSNGTAGTLTGDLTLKGVTRSVQLTVEFLGGVTDPWGNDRALVDAHGRINREDWGVTWNMPLDAGGLLVSREIDIELHLEFVRRRS